MAYQSFKRASCQFRDYDDQRFVEVKEILKSQNMIDEIIVKNSDDIALMLKVRDEHENAMQLGTENLHA